MTDELGTATDFYTLGPDPWSSQWLNAASNPSPLTVSSCSYTAVWDDTSPLSEFTGNGGPSVFYCTAQALAGGDNYYFNARFISGNTYAAPTHSKWVFDSSPTLAQDLSGLGTNMFSFDSLRGGSISGVESGSFDSSLMISGVPVSTGDFEGYWSKTNTVENIYYTGGNVGIGTDSPISLLQVSGTGANSTIARFTSSPDNISIISLESDKASKENSYIQWTHSGTRNAFMGWGQAGEYLELFLQNSSDFHITGGALLAPAGDFTESLTISGVPVSTGSGGKWKDGLAADSIYYSGGNVGVGVEDPSAQLTVSGSTIISGSALFYVDYDQLPKSEPSEKGRVWIDSSNGNVLKVAVGAGGVISTQWFELVGDSLKLRDTAYDSSNPAIEFWEVDGNGAYRPAAPGQTTSSAVAYFELNSQGDVQPTLNP